MAKIVTYHKRLCMTELAVQYSSIASPRFFDSIQGKINSSLIYVSRGNAELISDGKKILVRSGDLFYIPENIHYTAKWYGSPNIEYYCLHAVSRHYDVTPQSVGFALQTIPSLSSPKVGEHIKAIFNLMSDDNRVSKLKAISLYYSLYAEVLPLLEEDQVRVLHPALDKAICIINRDYATSAPIGDVAKACFISESRLYHLFQDYLKMTPVAYRNNRRIERALELLRTPMSIEEICGEVGFHSPVYFREIFKKHTGLSPAKYRSIIS